MEYKVVAGPTTITIKGEDTRNASKVFSELINKEAAEGWIFHSIQTVPTLSKSGFIKKHVEEKNVYLLIFSKESYLT